MNKFIVGFPVILIRGFDVAEAGEIGIVDYVDAEWIRIHWPFGGKFIRKEKFTRFARADAERLLIEMGPKDEFRRLIFEAALTGGR